MKRGIKGSLTVEAVMLFPLIFILLVWLLQCGFYYVFSVSVKCWCDQGILVYQEALDQGAKAQEAVDSAGKYVEKRLKEAGLKKVHVLVRDQGRWLYKEVHIEAEGEYRFLFASMIQASSEGEWREARTLRDTVEVLREISLRIPGIGGFWKKYEEMMDQCVDGLSQEE